MARASICTFSTGAINRRNAWSTLPRKVNLKNYWTGESLGQHEGEFRVPALAPHTALLLEAKPVGR